MHEALSDLCVASRRLPPQDPRLTGHEGTMMLNGAYLVPEEDSASFAAAVETVAAASPGVQVDCRGPWPPYSFAALDGADGVAGSGGGAEHA